MAGQWVYLYEDFGNVHVPLAPMVLTIGDRQVEARHILPDELIEVAHAVDPLFETFRDQLDRRKAGSCAPWLEHMVGRCGTKRWLPDADAPTPGNLGRHLAVLLAWANAAPDAMFYAPNAP